ncbi:hypothetical protein M1E11_16740 [Bacillus sp. JZ8]
MSVFFHPYTYLSRPNGQSQFLNDYYQMNFYAGQEKEITLPTSFHKFFESGKAKGLDIYHGSSRCAYYVKLSKDLEIEITYR